MDSNRRTIFQYFKMRKMTMSFFGRSQYADWKILLGCTGIGMVCAMLYGIYLYSTVNRSDFFESGNPAVKAKKIDRQILTQMLSKAKEKKDKFEELKTNRPQVTDPSI